MFLFAVRKTFITNYIYLVHRIHSIYIRRRRRNVAYSCRVPRRLIARFAIDVTKRAIKGNYSLQFCLALFANYDDSMMIRAKNMAENMVECVRTCSN